MTGFKWMHFLKVPTRSTSDNSELPASTRFVHNVVDAGGGGTGGNGAALSSSVAQVAHGFTVLTPIYYDIDANAWTKAKADSADTLATHVVTSVADVDNFTAGQIGKFTVASHGLAEGYWFTSASTAGGVTQDDQSYSNPVFFVLDADTVFVLGYRPSSSNWDSFMFPNEIAITSAITLDEGNIGKTHICSGTSADYAVILPTPVGHLGELISFRMDAALTKLVTLDAGVGKTIDGERYRPMHDKEHCVLRSNGTEWQKIAGVTIPMSCSIRMGANQTFSANTAATIAMDILDYLSGPSSMASLANHTITVLRTGKYSLSARARFSNNTTATFRYMWISGVNCPRDFIQTPASWQGLLKVEGTLPISAGVVLSAVGYYEGGSPNPSITGDTAISSRETVLTVVEVPTW